MINFRFHLVSIAAILLALAAGIALGSGPLNDARTSLGVASTNSAVDPGLTAFESSYAGRTSASLLKGSLKGQSVVVMTVPGSSVEQVDGIKTYLRQAGAEVTGQIELSAKLLDPAERQFAEGVAQQAAKDVPAVSAAGDGYGRIGAALGRSLLAVKPSPVDPAALTIRSAFTQGGLFTLAAAPKMRATLAVLVTGPQRSGGADQSSVIAAIAGALNASGTGVVVAGPSSSSTNGGAVKAVRDGSTAVSTVDVTDSPAGWVLTALVASRSIHGQPGSWGTTRSADGPLPK